MGDAITSPPGYEAAELKGTGATSRVFRAIATDGGRVVALKRLHRHLVRSSDALARLRRELEALQKLNHPAIVPVHEVIRWQGDPTIVMDYVEGEDLAQIVEREGPLPPERVASIARALFDVLATVHAAGIVHRDVKPHNVRLGSDGAVHLLDFGSARLDAASQLTRTGTTVGTPEYMPPELFVAPVYDPRVDLFGVGATLFACLTGHPPQTADSLAQLAHLRSTTSCPEVESVREGVPMSLAYVIDRCLATEPSDRFASAALAVWALEHPGEARAFAARRRLLPLCLGCGEGIDPKSKSCPACDRREPFRYPPGRSHVVIDSVVEPRRLVDHVLPRFPELASDDGLDALGRTLAGLSWSPQRYASDLGAQTAESVASELCEAGVRARVTRDAPPGGWLVPLGLGLAGGIAAQLVQLPFAVGAVVAVLPWLGVVKALRDAARRRGLLAKVEPISPEPTAAERRAIWSAGDLSAAPNRSEDRMPPAVRAVVLMLFVSLVPIEMYALAGVAGWRHTVSRRIEGPQPLRDDAESLIPAPIMDPRRRETPPPSKDRPVWLPGMPPEAPEVPLARKLAPFAVLALLAFGFFAALVYRKREREVDAARAEIDEKLVRAAARRRRPDRRRGGRSALPPGALDAFQRKAWIRAAELSALVSPQEGARYRELIGRVSPSPAASDRALAARCIMETDPDYDTRFALLEIEGTLEAEAARRWAGELPEGSDA